VSRGAGGLDVKTGKPNANQSTPRVRDIAVACEATDIPVSRRARLMGASALAGGALRGLAVAAGMVTVFGGAPAFAGCQSSATDLSAGTSCAATASTGVQATAVGLNANATGTNATAYGFLAIANGAAAGATGAQSTANGADATATGVGSTANGINATATGFISIANGAAATATGSQSNATGTNATATGAGSLANGAAATATGTLSIALLQENLQHGLNQAYEGTAIAIAMGGAALPDNKRFAVTTNWGNFRGTNAMSLVAQMRISPNVVANAGFAGGFQYGGVGSRAGLTFAW
jgi:hypothetical protein